MNAKIFKDGERVIISFEGLEDAEAFLQKVVEIASGTIKTEVPVVDIPDLEPPPENNEELFAEEMEIETPSDFGEPFTGKTPDEIIVAPMFEGFYYLCRAIKTGTVPSHYIEETRTLVIDFFANKKVLVPPFGNIERMKKYLKMAQNILGADVIPDDAYQLEDQEWLETACETALAKLQEFVESLV